MPPITINLTYALKNGILKCLTVTNHNQQFVHTSHLIHYELTETVTAGDTLLLYSYLFQRFQPCLPPCCSLLCPQCSLFCWWQLLLVIFVTQEPLYKESQSGLQSMHNVWTTNIMNIIILQIHQSLNQLTARLGDEVICKMEKIRHNLSQ